VERERYENMTSDQVGGKYHSDKANQYINALNNWIKGNPYASKSDIMKANSMLKDLEDAVGK